jgi:hypothetical protein
MTIRQTALAYIGKLTGFRGVLGTSKDGTSTRYAIGTRQHRRTVTVRTLSMMEFV